MPSNLRHDHLQMNTLIRWHLYANLARIPYVCVKMNFQFPTSRLWKVIVLQSANLCIYRVAQQMAQCFVRF